MRLFRGLTKAPRGPVPKLEEELTRLEEELSLVRKNVGDSPLKILQSLGPEKVARLTELRRICNNRQFFTTDEEAARGCAGENGYLMVLNIDDKVAVAHFSGIEHMSREGKVYRVDNYTFSPDEIAALARE